MTAIPDIWQGRFGQGHDKLETLTGLDVPERRELSRRRASSARDHAAMMFQHRPVGPIVAALIIVTLALAGSWTAAGWRGI
jgi:hypothetical protein